MSLFKNKNGGIFADVIRCDEPSYLIWKWHPQSSDAGNNKRENSIRWGSSLRVKEGSVAIFVYNQNGAKFQDYIEGPFDAKIDTKNLPILSSILGLAFSGDSPFQAEVYFVNLAELIQVRFAVPYFDVFDPRFLDFAVPTAVRGSINFRITDYKDFIRIHRLENFSINDFNNQIKDAVIRFVKNVVANCPADNGIPVLQLERKIAEINTLVENDIRPRFYDNFGVTVSAVDVAVIEIDKTSEGYKHLIEVTRDLAAQTAKAQTEVNIKEMRDTQKLGVLGRAATMVADIKENQYAKHKQTQTANYAAYQTEAAEHVGIAGAEGLGKMGANGGGSIGGGMNPAAMMAGMAVGTTIGQNLARNIQQVNNSVPQPQSGVANTIVMTPPPVPITVYHVAINGQATGPYDVSTLSKMVTNGQLTEDTLVWTPGMNAWEKAVSVEAIRSLFVNTPPPIPAE